jgi:hypothetical protein
MNDFLSPQIGCANAALKRVLQLGVNLRLVYANANRKNQAAIPTSRRKIS